MKRATDDIKHKQEKQDISIHALVKRATAMQQAMGKPTVISIHALVKRATKLQSQTVNTILYFNPRPREEGDRIILSITL